MCGTDTADLTRQIDGFIADLKRDVSRGDIDADLAQSYADHFGRSITTRYRVNLTIEVVLEVEVPAGYDIDEISDELEVSIGTEHWNSDISIEDTDICSIQVDESEDLDAR